MRLAHYDYDYATLTTYDRELMYVGRDIAMTTTKGMSYGSNARQGGYSGIKIEGLFVGAKTQFKSGQAFEHFIARLWGDRTHDRMLIVQDYVAELKATRIDVQATFVTESEEPLRKTFEAMKETGLNVKFVESDTETVYVGSRQSQRFIRIYEKVGKDAYPFLRQEEREIGMRVIRFEIEFKDQLAEQAWVHMDITKTPLLPILAAEIGAKHVQTKMMNDMLRVIQNALQGRPEFHLRGKRKDTDPYVFFKSTILPWLLARKNKLEGEELENVEEWIQSGFNYGDEIPF
jgi:hypothetical protein